MATTFANYLAATPYNRVKETSTSTGTSSTIVLLGAVTRFRSFSVVGDGNSCIYAVTMGDQWEIRRGTYTAAGTSLSADDFIDSSTGSAIAWGAGTKQVLLTMPAEMLAVIMSEINSKIGSTHDGSIVLSTTGSADRSIEVGQGRTVDGNSYFDLISDATYTDYGARFLRLAGANGGTQLTHRGTGDFSFVAIEAAEWSIWTTNVKRLSISGDGATIYVQNAAAWRTGLGLVIGTDVVAYTAWLNTLSGYANAATTFNSIKQAATTGASGAVELTTNAEAQAGVDTTRAVTAAALASTAGVLFQGYDPDTLKADIADILTAGFATTPYNAGTKSSGTFTPVESNGNFQYATNNGAHTLAPPSNNCNMVIQYTNGASAGAITTSSFTMVNGDSFTTTNGHDFFCFITKNNGFSLLTVVALQ